VTFSPPLTINETAQALNTSRTRIYEILARGEMIAFKQGGRTMIAGTEVERYYASLPVAKFAPLRVRA
jgi:excisionase family DNA binding protein